MIKTLFNFTGLADRKKFAIFNACTLIVSPVLGILFMKIMNIGDPFAHIWKWLAASLLIWNLIGSIKFHDIIFDTNGALFARAASFILIFLFPIVYLHNLWCIIKIKKNEVPGN